MSIIAVGHFPAGYECERATRVKEGGVPIDALSVVTSVWLVPGGAKVYCHSATTEKALLTEDYWQAVAERVQHHVRSRDLKLGSYLKGVSTYNGMALSDRPPPTPEYSNVQALTINVPAQGAADAAVPSGGHGEGHDLNAQ